MSCAAGHAISKNCAGLHLWKALGSCFLVLHLGDVYVQNRPFVAQRWWHCPRVRGFSPTVASPLWKYSHWWYLNAFLTWTRCHPRGFTSRDVWRDSQGKWGCMWKCSKVEKWHLQSHLSLQNTGRGSVRHVICVFILPHPLLQDFVLIFPEGKKLNIVNHGVMAHTHHTRPSVIGAGCKANYGYLLCKNYLWLLQKLCVWAKQSWLSMFKRHLISSFYSWNNTEVTTNNYTVKTDATNSVICLYLIMKSLRTKVSHSNFCSFLSLA